MKHLIKIVVPVALGIVAAILNFMALKQPSFSYVAVKTAISEGQQFSKDNESFTRVEVPAKIPGAIPWTDLGVLRNAAAPRDLEAGDLVLMRDITVPPPQLKLEPGEVAINLSLDSVKFEPRLLKLGQNIGFAVRGGSTAVPVTGGGVTGVDTPTNGTSGAGTTGGSTRLEPQYEVLGPFRIVSLGRRLRESASGEEPAPSNDSQTTMSVARTVGAGNVLDTLSSRLIEANRTQLIGAVVIYPEKYQPSK